MLITWERTHSGKIKTHYSKDFPALSIHSQYFLWSIQDKMSQQNGHNSSCARDEILSLTCSCATGKKRRSCGTGYASWRQRNTNFSTSTRSRSMRYDITRKFSYCHQKCVLTTSPTWISSKQILGWGPNYKEKVSGRLMRTFLITQSIHKISVNQLLIYRRWRTANNHCALGK